MVPLKKKPNATECNDHRTISLITHASKILLNILTKRIESKVTTTNYIGEDQYGFRRGKGTRDAIAVLRCLGERSLEHGKDLYICFVDYEKAFDRVNWLKLMEVLQQVGVDKRDRDLIKNLYTEQTVVIRVDGKDSEAAKIGRGVRQGCPMSPQEFNIYIEALMKKAMENQKDGVKVGGQIVQAVRFADDQAMVANSNAGLQRIMDCLNKTSEEYGMKINLKKTKVMRISRNEGSNIDGEKLEQVKQFSYLGSTVTDDGKSHSEIKKTYITGKRSLQEEQRTPAWKTGTQFEEAAYKNNIWSVVLYGSETWTMQKEDVKRLEAFEMWLYRRIMEVKWTEHKTNEEVLAMMEDKRMFIKTIRERQKNWVGHVLRSDTLLQTVWEGRMEGRKLVGRQRMKLLDWMIRETDNKTYGDLKKMALDRRRWRTWNLGPV